MDTSLQPVAKTPGMKTWGVMDRGEKMRFVAKLCLMFASFGWIY